MGAKLVAWPSIHSSPKPAIWELGTDRSIGRRTGDSVGTFYSLGCRSLVSQSKACWWTYETLTDSTWEDGLCAAGVAGVSSYQTMMARRGSLY